MTSMMTCIKVCFLLLSAVLSASVYAENASQAERFARLAGVRLSDLPGFAHLQKRFGVSRVVQTGDAGRYDARICYRTAQARSVVEFFHGEVNWGFVLRKSGPHDARCPISAAFGSSPSVAGIRLGMPRLAYEQMVGPTRELSRHRLESHFSCTHVLTDDELSTQVLQRRKNGYVTDNPEDLRRWSVDIYITGSFIEGRLASVVVDRIETQ